MCSVFNKHIFKRSFQTGSRISGPEPNAAFWPLLKKKTNEMNPEFISPHTLTFTVFTVYHNLYKCFIYTVVTFYCRLQVLTLSAAGWTH